MLPTKMRVYLAKDAVDFRRSYDGLCGVVRDVLCQDPEAPTLFVFRNKRGDQVKILWNDGNGYAIWMKRLCRGTFSWSTPGEVSASTLALMFEATKHQ